MAQVEVELLQVAKIGKVGKVRQELAGEVVPLEDSAKAINSICCHLLCCLISGVEIQAWQQCWIGSSASLEKPRLLHTCERHGSQSGWRRSTDSPHRLQGCTDRRLSPNVTRRAWLRYVGGHSLQMEEERSRLRGDNRIPCKAQCRAGGE